LIDIDKITKEINENLESLGRKIITEQIKQSKNSLFNLYRKEFFLEIDSPLQHQTKWHQWGIITHTRKFLEMYKQEVQEDLKHWGVSEIVDKKLSEEIDGISKEKLLYIAILLHDIGKFQKTYIEHSNLKVTFRFKNHEKYSQHIIENELYPLLHNHYRLTKQQISYIGICARYHFELGFIREEAKKTEYGYSLKFVHSELFHELISKRINTFKAYSIEVGILFLGDSYAKTEIGSLQDLEKQNQESRLFFAVQQKEVNIEVAKAYFRYTISSNQRD
jgi:hypothetical protein